jgi:hypothetical protein
MLIARTGMVESGLGGRFWFKVVTAGVDAHNTQRNIQGADWHYATPPHVWSEWIFVDS